MVKLELLILGGGNGPHCYMTLASNLPDVNVRLLTLFGDEAERLRNAVNRQPLRVTACEWEDGKEEEFVCQPCLITDKPEEAVPGAHLIVFVVPAFAHQQYFDAMKPYLEPGMSIVGMPGGSGWHFQALEALGDKVSQYNLVTCSTLPWACRIDKFGEQATIKSTKDSIGYCTLGDPSGVTVLGKSVSETLRYTLHNKLVLHLRGHVLADCLAYGNGFIHPSLEYGMWSTWDQVPLDHVPDFYHGATQLGADTVDKVASEVVSIKNAIVAKRPDIEMIVRHSYEAYIASYGDLITDQTNLYTIFHSCKPYTGIKHPMVEVEPGKFIPDFKHRYFTEDIPFGQVVFKGVALIVGVETPTIDTVITWAQGVMGKEYLVSGKLEGKDIKETRCPQRYGITTLEGLLGEI